MSDNPFKELQDAHPIWEFRNKTNTVQNVPLAHGDSIKVAGRSDGGVLKLQSKKFHQLPPFSTFTFIKPSLDDLRAVGLLKDDAPKSNSDSTTSQPETSAEDAE